MRFLGLTSVVACALLMSACATDISSKSYSDEHVGEAAQTYRATVIKVRKVSVAPDKLEKNRMGAIGGGAVGAVLGSTMGAGVGKTLMTIGGAGAGAVGGAFAEKGLKTQTALEITVELKDGEMRTVVQGDDVQFNRGDKVLVMVNIQGRSKIVKDDQA